MLYGKGIEPRCAYCVHSHKIDDMDVLCKKYGPVDGAYHCRRFKYDPLKREFPKRITRKKKVFTQADFDLNAE